MSNLPYCLGNQSWPLALHNYHPLFSQQSSGGGNTFPQWNFNLIYTLWLKMGTNEKVVLWAISHVNSRFLPCIICTLLEKWGFYLSIWIIPPQNRSSMNQYKAAYFNVIFSIITYHWLSLAKCLISFLLKNNYAYLQVDLIYWAQTIIITPSLGFLWFLYIVFFLSAAWKFLF